MTRATRTVCSILLLSLALGTASAQLGGSAGPSSSQSRSTSSDPSAAVGKCLDNPPSQIYPSPSNSERFYFVLQNAYSAGEADIAVLDTSDCYAVVIPVADFLTQLQLTGQCSSASQQSSRGSVQNHVGGRRLLAAADAALTHALARRSLSDPGTDLGFVKFSGHARALADDLAAEPDSASSSSSDEDARMHIHDNSGNIPPAPPSSSSSSPPPSGSDNSGSNGDDSGSNGDNSGSNGSGSTGSKTSSASPQGNNCDQEFLASLKDYEFAQSTLEASTWYFLLPDISYGDAPEPHTGLCKANFEECDARCIDYSGFQAATDSDLADLCQLAGL